MERRSFFKSVGVLCGFLWLPATHSLSSGEGFPKPGKDDRCPVCGMFVNKYPKWAAGFVFHSGARYFHCCPKCMVHNLLSVPKYQPGETRENIRQIWITEYYTTRQRDAREVFFIAGTSLVGPMGLDLIPVAGDRAAETLKRDYNGESILRLDQITPDILDKARRGQLK
ncbi:nitrous oxide reductase accessory protein NosL [Desulfomonile tiedjei]|uniref:Putative lipoprotein involved in nitrous oxide reduction n=1 Tax=Desulfomonile tiedjei (strain ATCC 49306 / DSM 6799 / DCB-1) TaxID=706587 RepID=I4C1F7_DESTA|nr:nitrous oxide reductase accessory protein NosL [Desulfomonile tiedjei]AFM23398.1 putative lipoprotein involved in nitrous oxide reduction [Desulfomonile tiedjei DSM 6799]